METESTESQPLMKKTSCAFTGHRPTRFSFKYEETHPTCIELKRILAEQINALSRSPLRIRNGQRSSKHGIAPCWIRAAM